MNKPDEQQAMGRVGMWSMVQLLATIITLVINFPLQIYIARKLGSEAIGTFALISLYAGVMGTLLDLGISGVLERFVPQHMALKENGLLRLLLTRSFALLLAIGLVVAALLLLLSQFEFQINYFQLPVTMESWFLPSIALLMVFGILNGPLVVTLRAMGNMRLFIIVGKVIPSLGRGILVVLLLEMGMEVGGLVAASVGAVALAVIVAGQYVLRYVARVPQETIIDKTAVDKGWFEYAKIRYFGNFINAMYAPLDRTILGGVSGVGVVGVHAVVNTLNRYPIFILESLVVVIAPLLAQAWAQRDMAQIQQLYSVTTSWVVRFTFPALVLIFLFSTEILLLFGPEFAEIGSLPLRIFLLSKVANICFGPVGIIMNMCGEEKFLLRIQMIVLAVSALLLYPMIAQWGLLGLAVVFGVQVTIVDTLMFWRIHKQLGINWRILCGKRIVVASLVVMVGTALLKSYVTSWGIVALVAAIGGIYCLFHLLFWIWGIPNEDREVFQMVRQRFSN